MTPSGVIQVSGMPEIQNLLLQTTSDRVRQANTSTLAAYGEDFGFKRVFSSQFGNRGLLKTWITLGWLYGLIQCFFSQLF